MILSARAARGVRLDRTADPAAEETRASEHHHGRPEFSDDA
jgi:hypothetical protein